jgi:hypothetical protein
VGSAENIVKALNIGSKALTGCDHIYRTLLAGRIWVCRNDSKGPLSAPADVKVQYTLVCSTSLYRKAQASNPQPQSRNFQRRSGYYHAVVAPVLYLVKVV